jgi:peptidoglycan hydrolase-like protein with peptidoglycan-binding domain
VNFKEKIMVSTTAVCTGNPTLKTGSKGKNVEDLQKMLNDRVGNRQQIKVDSIFGAATEKLVKMMQYRYFLTQDGIVGAQTWHVLCTGTLVEQPLLQIGSKSPLVSRVQQVLRDGSYYAGNPDGLFGIQTERAVKTLQQNRELQPDGKIGDRTWGVLVEVAHQLTAT